MCVVYRPKWSLQVVLSLVLRLELWCAKKREESLLGTVEMAFIVILSHFQQAFEQYVQWVHLATHKHVLTVEKEPWQICCLHITHSQGSFSTNPYWWYRSSSTPHKWRLFIKLPSNNSGIFSTSWGTFLAARASFRQGCFLHLSCWCIRQFVVENNFQFHSRHEESQFIDLGIVHFCMDSGVSLIRVSCVLRQLWSWEWNYLQDKQGIFQKQVFLQ